MTHTIPRLEESGGDDFLHAVLLRSTIHRGRIVDFRAPEPPQDYVIVTHYDLPAENRITVDRYEMPILAAADIAYRGQPIAVVAGPDLRTCVRIRDEIEVTYERDEPITFSTEPDTAPILAERRIESGDTKEAFSSAYQLIEGEYTLHPARYRLLDTIGAAARIDERGVEVWAPTRWLYHVRDTVANALGVETREVNATLCVIESHDDGYVWRPSHLAALAALSARKAGKPVRLIVPAGEADAQLHAPGARIIFKSGLDREGTLQAVEAEIIASTGAFGFFRHEYLDRLCITLRDSYKCRSYRIHGRIIDLNMPPTERYVGFGTKAGAFVSELHATRMAELATEDPASWRARHIRTGITPNARTADRLLDEVASKSDFHRKFAAYEMQKKRRDHIKGSSFLLRGVGIAKADVCGGFLGNAAPVTPTVRIRMDSEGLIELGTSNPTSGRMHVSILQHVAAEALGVAPGEISIVPKRTGAVPDSGPAILGHDLSVNARLVKLCAESLNKRRFREPLPLEESKSSRKKPRSQWNRDTLTGNPCVGSPSAAMVVEVEVDPISLQIGIKGVWAVASIGKILDRHAARMQFTAELAEAFEHCRNSEQRWEESSNFVHSIGEAVVRRIPPLDIRIIEDAEDEPQSIGGLAASTFVPAFVGAVSQATGFYFDSVPISNDVLHRYVEVL